MWELPFFFVSLLATARPRQGSTFKRRMDFCTAGFLHRGLFAARTFSARAVAARQGQQHGVVGVENPRAEQHRRHAGADDAANRKGDEIDQRHRHESRWNGVLERCIVGAAGPRLERAVPFWEESLHDTRISSFDR